MTKLEAYVWVVWREHCCHQDRPGMCDHASHIAGGGIGMLGRCSQALCPVMLSMSCLEDCRFREGPHPGDRLDRGPCPNCGDDAFWGPPYAMVFDCGYPKEFYCTACGHTWPLPSAPPGCRWCSTLAATRCPGKQTAEA